MTVMMSGEHPMREREEALFRLWQASLPQDEQESFVSDGIVDPTAYNRSSPKILFLLKEVNDTGGGGWCLREYLRKGGRSETWGVVARWLRALRKLPVELRWDQIKDVTEAQRCEELESIAAINLKKIPGGHTTNVGTWWPIVERDQGIFVSSSRSTKQI